MPAPREVIIGLDVGTSRVKAVAFGSGERPWQAMAERPQGGRWPGPDRHVHDPDELLGTARDVVRECVEAAGSAEVAALSVSAAMHGLMGLDADHRPLTPLVTWADARALPEARELRHDDRSGGLHGRTGVPLHPMTPLAKLMWFRRREPAIFAEARWWVGLKDHLLHWLTGDLVTELSSASATGLLDVRTRAWSPEALALAGLRDDQLPPILPTTAVLGLASAPAAQLGLPAGTPVVTGAGDGPLANLGVGALSAGVAGLSIGTSAALRVAVDEPRVDDDRMLFCYALTDAIWLVGGALSNGGSVAQWAASALAPDMGHDELLTLAASAPPGCDGLVMVPHLVAERAPLEQPGLAGAYLGLRADHTRAHLARAAVEGVGLQVRALFDRVDRAVPVTGVRATGGALSSPLWREVVGAVLDRPVTFVDDVEGSALGAAALGLVALGRAPDPVVAVERLWPAALAGRPSPAAPELAATYRTLAASIPDLVQGLTAAADLLPADGAGVVRGTAG